MGVGFGHLRACCIGGVLRHSGEEAVVVAGGLLLNVAAVVDGTVVRGGVHSVVVLLFLAVVADSFAVGDAFADGGEGGLGFSKLRKITFIMMIQE